MKTLEFCSGFAQGATSRFSSRGLAVGGNGRVAAIVGYSKQPADFKETESAAETTFLKSALQGQYGGGKDGYLAILATEESEAPTPRELVQNILKRRYATPSPLISEAIRAKTLGDIVARLSAGNPSEQQAAQLIATIGANQLKRVQAMATTEPFIALENLKDISSFWAGSELATAAEKSIADLEADEAFQNRLAAAKLVKSISDLQAGMRDARGAKANTYTDPFYFKRNSSKMNRMKKTFEKLLKEFPDTPEVGIAKAQLNALEIPLTKADEDLFKILQTCNAHLLPSKNTARYEGRN